MYNSNMIRANATNVAKQTSMKLKFPIIVTPKN